MAVIIRLRRMGRTNSPFFRLVAADDRTATNGRFLEILGWYDPLKNEANYNLKMDRIDHWLENGARISDTARNLVKQARTGKSAVEVPTPPPAEEEAAPVEAPATEPAPVAEETPAEQPVAEETTSEETDPAQKDG